MLASLFFSSLFLFGCNYCLYFPICLSSAVSLWLFSLLIPFAFLLLSAHSFSSLLFCVSLPFSPLVVPCRFLFASFHYCRFFSFSYSLGPCSVSCFGVLFSFCVILISSPCCFSFVYIGFLYIIVSIFFLLPFTSLVVFLLCVSPASPFLVLLPSFLLPHLLFRL